LRKRRILPKIILVVVLFLLSLVAWAFLIEPNRLVIHRERIDLASSSANSPPLRIAAIGDIHAGSPFINTAKLKQLVELTNNQQPDLIVLLGDYMIRDGFFEHPIEPEIIAAILKDLHAPLGVFAVLGNHDNWYNGERVTHAFESSGIPVLDNQVRELRPGEHSIWLVGLADSWTGRHDVAGTLGQVPPGASIILLTHNPDIFAHQIPNRVQLTLAAHTHGGQVNLPFFGRLIVPSQYGQRYAAGIIREDGKTMFVTTGVGTSILPVRFRVPPEITVLTIQGL
jgi:hypothetical protein